MAKYRCLNKRCWDSPNGAMGHDFAAEQPICDKCGVDGRDVRFGHLVMPLVTIHYCPPHPAVDGVGKDYIACTPTTKVWGVGKKGEQITGEPSAVTCDKCKAAPEFPKEWTEMDPSRVPLMVPGQLGG